MGSSFRARAMPAEYFMVAILKKTHGLMGPWANGILLAPWEFDSSQFERGNRYELINGVLIVSPAPLENQRDPNDELGRWLRNYQDEHPESSALDATLPEHTIRTGANRRVADLVVWTGLGRIPNRSDIPSLVIEFVSEGKRNIDCDYKTKRDKYFGCGVKEYWIIDRFERSLTALRMHGEKIRKRVFKANQRVTTRLLPGFEFPLAKLLELAQRWEDQADS